MKALITAPTTANGHKIIARPANGTQTVSKKGPSLPIKSWNSRCHPRNNMKGLFQSAIAVINGTSMGIASKLTSKQLGSFDNLQKNNKKKKNSITWNNKIFVQFY